jgi:hypothetical protein
VDPVPDPLLLRKSGSARNRTRTSGSVARINSLACSVSNSIQNVLSFFLSKNIWIIYKDIIYLFFVCFVLREEHGLKLLENRVLGRTSGPDREKARRIEGFTQRGASEFVLSTKYYKVSKSRKEVGAPVKNMQIRKLYKIKYEILKKTDHFIIW